MVLNAVGDFFGALIAAMGLGVMGAVIIAVSVAVVGAIVVMLYGGFAVTYDLATGKGFQNPFPPPAAIRKQLQRLRPGRREPEEE